VVAGLAVGLVFILANMIYATSQPALVDVPTGPKLPAIAPFLDIGTIFYFDDMPLLTHLGFGLLLVPFFLTTVSRYGEAPAAQAAVDRVEERRRAAPAGP